MSCPAWNDHNRPAVLSTLRCPGNLSTVADCPDGYKKFDPNTLRYVDTDAGYCFGDSVFGTPERHQGVCFKDTYPEDISSIVKCCSGETSQYNCDPKYCRNSQSCKDFMKRYCTGDKLGSEPCKTWASNNPADANATLDLYCNGANLENPICKNWCGSNRNKCTDNIIQYCTKDKFSHEFCKNEARKKDLSGHLDTEVTKFCAEHPNDDFCSCQSYDDPKDPIEVRAIKSRPDCTSSLCRNKGYMFGNLNPDICPNIKICKQDIDMVDNENLNMKNVTIALDCGDDSVDNTLQQNKKVIEDVDILTAILDDSQFLPDYIHDITNDYVSDRTFIILIIGMFIILIMLLEDDEPTLMDYSYPTQYSYPAQYSYPMINY